jgi:hypothetical protein
MAFFYLLLLNVLLHEVKKLILLSLQLSLLLLYLSDLALEHPV